MGIQPILYRSIKIATFLMGLVVTFYIRYKRHRLPMTKKHYLKLVFLEGETNEDEEGQTYLSKSLFGTATALELVKEI